ncbi:MAG: serine hydrolase [Pseudomonadota bacterium]
MSNSVQTRSYALTGAIGEATALYAGRLGPNDLIVTGQNTQALFPTRQIKASDVSAPVPKSLHSLEDLVILSGDERFDIFDYLTRNSVVGLLVQKNGRTICERYEHGVTERTRWMSMSMAKSVSTTLAGVAVREGCIGGLDDNLADYLPVLRDSAYDGVMVRHLLQMTSGVAWNDVHTDPASDRRHMLTLQLQHQPGAILDYVSSRPRAAAPGTRWNYSTGETHIVGALVKAATGAWLSDYLTEKIWTPMGAEADAAWWLEAPAGLEVAGAGICATLRDYVRFCAFVMADGVIDGRRVLPEGWVAEATAPLVDAEAGRKYGFMWWPVPDADGGYADRAFSARGIFGQFVYVNPVKNLVIGVISARSKPRWSEAIPDNDFFNAVAAFTS